MTASVPMQIGSLFSGAGGLDLAAEVVFGGRVVWQAEINPAASKVLAHRFPDVPNLGDITTVDWATVPAVDVLSGGFPCQDVSTAGLRAGLKSGTRSGLFLSVIDVIRAVRPRYVLLENVIGLLSADGDVWPDEVVALDAEWRRWSRISSLIDHKKGKAERRGNRDRNWWHRKEAEGVRAARRERVAFQEFRRERLRLVPRAIETVLRSLAEVGYDAAWHCLRASDVGAPHQRGRIFILGTPADADYATGYGKRSRPEPGQRGEVFAHAARDGWDERRPESARFVGRPDTAVRGDGPVDLLPTPDANSGNDRGRGQHPDKRRAAGHAVKLSDVACHLLPTPSAADGEGGHLTRSGARSNELLLPGVARAYGRGELLPTPNASDGTGGGTHPDGRDGHSRQLIDYALLHSSNHWGKYEPAIRRWEQLTRPAPSPTEPNRNGNPRLAAAFAEWMMGWPAGWVTDVPGISRNDMLRIIGNGVCPQQAAYALRLLLSAFRTAS